MHAAAAKGLESLGAAGFLHIVRIGAGFSRLGCLRLEIVALGHRRGFVRDLFIGSRTQLRAPHARAAQHARLSGGRFGRSLCRSVSGILGGVAFGSRFNDGRCGLDFGLAGRAAAHGLLRRRFLAFCRCGGLGSLGARSRTVFGQRLVSRTAAHGITDAQPRRGRRLLNGSLY